MSFDYYTEAEWPIEYLEEGSFQTIGPHMAAYRQPLIEQNKTDGVLTQQGAVWIRRWISQEVAEDWKTFLLGLPEPPTSVNIFYRPGSGS